MDTTSIFIVSAPSGSGKSTLVERLLASVPNLVFSISYTTRRPRGVEQNAKHYYFVGRDEFQRMIENDELLEWAVLFGRDFYGTSRRFLDEARRLGHDLVLDIDVQGAAQLKQRLPEAHSIFILPPSRNEMEKRLRRRGEDSEEVIQRRLERAVGEIQDYPKYDYVVVNDDLDKATEKLCAIVQAARRRKRNDGQEPDPRAQRWLELSRACETWNAEPHVAPIIRTFREERASGSY